MPSFLLSFCYDLERRGYQQPIELENIEIHPLCARPLSSFQFGPLPARRCIKKPFGAGWMADRYSAIASLYWKVWLGARFKQDGGDQ